MPTPAAASRPRPLTRCHREPRASVAACTWLSRHAAWSSSSTNGGSMAEAEVKASPEGVPGALRDPSAVRAEDLQYPGAGGTPVNGYLVRPAGAAAPALPAMIVIHEAGGLGEHIRDVCNRFAALGYLSLGVDLYTREGG